MQTFSAIVTWVCVPTAVLVLISPVRAQEGESAQVRVRPSIRLGTPIASPRSGILYY